MRIGEDRWCDRGVMGGQKVGERGCGFVLIEC